MVLRAAGENFKSWLMYTLFDHYPPALPDLTLFRLALCWGIFAPYVLKQTCVSCPETHDVSPKILDRRTPFGPFEAV